jgi:1,4-alpha-glucan branching enzyme
MVTVEGEWVEFRFFRPGARHVCLAGEFNNWDAGNLPMVARDGGYWTARMKLPAGEFKFRYCADGEWFTDYAAFGVEPGQYGLDSVCRVVPTPRTVQIQSRQDETAAKEAGEYVAA